MTNAEILVIKFKIILLESSLLSINQNIYRLFNLDQFRVGQNIGWLGNNITVNINKVESIIQLWYDEVKNFNRYDVLKFR